MPDKFLFINADDVCASRNSESAVFSLVRKGIITGCGLMPNAGMIHEMEKSLKSAAPSVDIGIHINLTEGVPVSPAEKARSLVNSGGMFPGLAKFLLRYTQKKLNPDEVKLEIEAQFEAVRSATSGITFMDSHHHVHLLPEIAPIVAGLSVKHGISWYRGSSGVVSSGTFYGKNNTKYLLYNMLIKTSSGIYASEGMSSPEFVFQPPSGRAGRRMDALVKTLLSAAGAAEMVCHPEHYDPGKGLPTRLVLKQKSEVEFLKSLDKKYIYDKTGYLICGRNMAIKTP